MAEKKKRKPKRSPKKRLKKASVPGPDVYLKRLRAMKGEGADFSMFSDEDIPSITEFIPTGSLAIDKLINGANGGWPIGGISECAAWEHVGKSTLLDQSIAHCQRMGGVPVLVDSEKGRDKKWTELLGVDLDGLLTYPSDTIEDGFGGIEAALSVQEAMMKELSEPPPPMLIVWDSLGGTPTKAELQGAPDDSHMAVAARVIKMNFRRLRARLPALRCALVFANHFYNKIGGYGGLESYGGSGVKYHTELRLWLSKPEQIKISSDVVGHIVRARPKKNRISGSRDDVDTALVYGAGMDNTYTLLQWGKKAQNASGNPWIVQSGAWYWLYPPGEDPISFQRQFLGLGQIFEERPDLYKTMATQFLNDGS